MTARRSRGCCWKDPRASTLGEADGESAETYNSLVAAYFQKGRRTKWRYGTEATPRQLVMQQQGRGWKEIWRCVGREWMAGDSANQGCGAPSCVPVVAVFEVQLPHVDWGDEADKPWIKAKRGQGPY